MAELEAHVQKRFRFAGSDRVPGDVISADDLQLATPQTRDAMVSQGLIVLKGAGTPATEGERYDHAMARLDALGDALAQAGEDAAEAKRIAAEALELARRSLSEPTDALVEAIEQVALQSVRKAMAEAGPGATPVAQAKPARRGRRPKSKEA